MIRRSIAPARPAPEREPLAPATVIVGVALTAVLCAEIYLAVVVVALGAGKIVLAFGLVVDACARTLGTTAAARVKSEDWAWACVLIGSPAVAIFALFQDSGPVDAPPAPLAGLLSLLALGIIAIALLSGLFVI